MLYYCIVQSVRGTNLILWLVHHVSIQRKTFVFASNQCSQVLKHFEICKKTFAIQAKTAEIAAKILAFERFALYGMPYHDNVMYFFVALLLLHRSLSSAMASGVQWKTNADYQDSR